MANKRDRHQFKTNVPCRVTFEFDEPKKMRTHDQYGDSYMYTVTIDNVDGFPAYVPGERVWFATEYAHNFISEHGPRKGDTWVISMVELDGNAKGWEAILADGTAVRSYDAGAEILKTLSRTTRSPSPPTPSPPQQEGNGVQVPSVPPPRNPMVDIAATMRMCLKAAYASYEGYEANAEVLERTAVSIFIEARRSGAKPSDQAVEEILRILRDQRKEEVS